MSYDSGIPMRNLWIQTEHAFVTWVADLGSAGTRPQVLLDVTMAILEAGSRHRVFLPVAAPAIGFDRGHGETLVELLMANWSERRIVDVFAFTAAAMAPGAPGSSTVEAAVAWFDRSDSVIEGVTTDLGSVLRELEPVPGSIGEGLTVPMPPIRITGPLVRYDASGQLADPRSSRSIELRIALHSDVWMPYVFGSAHPLADHRHHFDNRVLANVHTPRLNHFLRDVATAVARAGGKWEVDRDETSTDAGQWLDRSGIHLDAPPPALFAPEALDAEWF